MVFREHTTAPRTFTPLIMVARSLAREGSSGDSRPWNTAPIARLGDREYDSPVGQGEPCDRGSASRATRRFCQVPTGLDLTTHRPRKVCLIKPSSLGDVVHATPILAALRSLWPDAHIAWVVNRGLKDLIQGLPELNEVIPFDRGARGLGAARALADLASRLRSGRFDVAIDLQGLLRSALFGLATGASVRVGLRDAREGAPHFYTHRISPAAGATHAVDRLMAIAAAFGAKDSAPRFLVSTSPADHEWAARQLGSIPGPRLVLNMGARWPTKRWPPASFARVAERAHQALGADLVLVGAPEDRPIVDEFLAQLGPIPSLDLCGKTTLPQLAAVASACDLFLTNDTGPMHLAAAAGARVVGIFTCTQPEKTGPYGPRCTVVRSGIWCAGSCVKKCSRLDCMRELEPVRVWEEVRRRLQADSEDGPRPHLFDQGHKKSAPTPTA